MSRLEKSAKNISLSFVSILLNSLFGFISRTIFIKFLGEQYLGLSGLLNNVLGFLSITELGFASAIGFCLYKPLADEDYDSVSALMTFYKKIYRIVAIIVLISGIALYFSLDFFIPVSQQPQGTSYAYFAFLFNIVVGYLLSYKTTLINSDNQAYKLIPINICTGLVQMVCQIFVLYLFKNYLAYILVQIMASVISAIIQNRYVTYKYDKIDFNSKLQLSNEYKTSIKRNVGGLLVQKIGDYLVNSTDNLIITKLVSLAATGIYSNYLLIRNMINGFIGTFFTGITASMGNVVAKDSDEHKLEIFNTTFFVAFIMYSFEAVCFMCLFNPFIGELWIGEKFLFNPFTVFIIVLNNFLTGLRMPLIIMKNAAGKYMEDAWIPFGFSIVNLLASVFLARYMGVAGVFLGTIIGSMLTADWYRPVIIYKHVFHVPVRKYFIQYLKYIILGLAYMAIAYGLCLTVRVNNVIIGFIIKMIIAVTIPIVLDIILFYKTKEFDIMVSIASRMKNMIKR